MPIGNELKQIMSFLHQAEKLKSVMRHSWLSSGRQEDTAEHTWRMALMAILLHKRLQSPANIERVLKMVLVHDLTEVNAGDYPAWNNRPSDIHLIEQTELKKLLSGLPSDLASEILELWEEFESQQTIEAKFATALDKLEVVIQHNEADLSTWNEKELDQKFNEIYGTQQCEYDPTLKEFRAIAKRDTVSKIRRRK